MYVKNHKSLNLIAASIIAASASSFAAAYQISPSPNYSTITISDTFAENWLEPFDNYGDVEISASGKLVTYGWLNNYSNLINYGSLEIERAELISDPYSPGEVYRYNGSVKNFSMLTNYGVLTNHYSFTSTGNLINYGSYINSSISGSLSNSNTVTNYGYVENHGTLAQTSTGIFYNYGTVDNFQSPYYGDGWVSIMGGDLFNRGIFYNFGTLNNPWVRNQSSGVIVNSGTINNSAMRDSYGTLENNGYWQNEDYIANSGELINTGTFINHSMSSYKLDNSGTISDGGVSWGHFTQYDGSETINNGIIEYTTIDILGGVLKGIGTLKGSVTIGSSATVIPGSSPGTLNIDGDLHSNGNYVFEIAGLNSGQYDLLDIDGNAFFTGGNFKFDFIDGFLSSAGDHWDFLVTDSLSGLESVNFTFAGLGDGLGIDLNNEGGKISLTVITAVPEPETYAMLLTGLGLMGLMTYRRKQKEAA